jgi:hypothetical protein
MRVINLLLAGAGPVGNDVVMWWHGFFGSAPLFVQKMD